ncbi:hypothetical protein J6590_107205, partial [Homalodisca vitripennis]
GPTCQNMPLTKATAHLRAALSLISKQGIADARAGRYFIGFSSTRKAVGENC